MRVCVFGAGAIGGYVAAKLAAVGDLDLSLVARGPHLAVIQECGLTLVEGGNESVYTIRAHADATTLGVQDAVFLALKAHSVPGALDVLVPLLGPDTAVVTMQNGVPWWYFYRHGGALKDTRIEAVDPGGMIWDRIGPGRAIGCVVYPATEVDAPGVVRHIDGRRLSLGEPSGDKSERVTRLSESLVAGGLQAPVRTDIRNEIWLKLWGNLSFNPISALTGATLEEIVADPEQQALARAMMVEAQSIAEKLGVTFPIDVDKRIAGAGKVGAHKTSMLQDLERGRPLEIDALVTAVQELGQLVSMPTPTIDRVLTDVQELAIARGLYQRPSA